MVLHFAKVLSPISDDLRSSECKTVRTLIVCVLSLPWELPLVSAFLLYFGRRHFPPTTLSLALDRSTYPSFLEDGRFIASVRDSGQHFLFLLRSVVSVALHFHSK